MNVRRGITALGIAATAVVTGFGGGTAHAGDNSYGNSQHSSASTSKVALTASVSGVPGQQEPLVVTADGALDYEAQKGELAVHVPDGQGGEISTHLIIDGTTVYVHVPEEGLTETGGKPWIKADLAQAAELTGVDPSMLSTSSSENPLNGREFVEASGAEVTYLGKERIRGVKTHHLGLTFDVDGTTQKAEVWIDRKDRIRQLSFSLDLATVDPQLSGELNINLEFFAFGTEVNVTAPPADQVLDLFAVQPELATPAPSAA